MTAAIALSEYREKLAGIPEDAFIGSIVWYSIAGQVERNDGKRTIVPVRVPQDQMIEWFEQLGLDPGLLPPPIKRIDAFRNASSNSKLEYPLDDDKTAELRIEEVKYDEHQVVRHVVKITRDARREQLSLDHLATLKFLRAGRTAKAKRPTGDDVKAQILTAISTQDREKATEILGIFNEKYEDLSNHLHRPAIAAIIRGYLLQKLNAIAMKTSGGLYFVHKSRWPEIDALQELVKLIGQGCVLEQVALLDTPGYRHMLTDAYQSEVEDECRLLLKQIAEVNEVSKGGAVPPKRAADLAVRYAQLTDRSAEYTEMLGLTQGRAAAALELAFEALADIQQRVSYKKKATK